MLGLASSGATRNALTKIMIENFEIKLPDLNTLSPPFFPV
jgi:restriction endonuclease S subunit